MNYLLTALSRYFLLPALFACFVFPDKAIAQTCNNWLGTPSTGSFVTIGDLDVTGNKLTVEAVFNRVSALGNGFNFGKLVSKHTDQTNVNYSLMPLQCEITTDVTGYVATPQVCLPTLDKTYHVAMVYDGVTLKFYRDGYLLTETPCTGNLVNNNLLTTIGQLAGPAHPLNMQHLGYINEVRIWNTARTQAELRAYMHIALPAPVQAGLVGYYSFNNLLNKQGNVAFNGTLNGQAQINQTNTNCAFAPDSCGVVLSPSCSNWLNTPSQPSWVNVGDLDVPGNQLTVEALINIKGIPPGGVIAGLDVVSKHTGPTNVNYLLRSAHAELSTTNGYFYTPDACDLEMNKTYHVAMVYNGVSLKYYRNGFLLGETPATGNMIQNNFPTGIGFISTLLQAENFIGFINEVRIWNVARSQAQIRANMNISLVNPPAQAGLQAYYTFDNLLNKQGNPAWNGTLVGAASINRTNPECVFVADTCAAPSPCDQSLSIPTQGSKVTVGDVDVTGNQLTVEAMFNRSAPLNNGVYYGHLVSKHTDQFNVNYALLPNGCEITTSVSGYKAIFQTCVPELGKTYHVAMVYDGATLKFYRNGFLMSQVACTGNIINNNLLTTIGQIARGDDPFDNQFLGYTNEVRIWNVARTQSQIATYMSTSLPNPATQIGLRAYYSFNDLRNKQGNAAFNGTLHGNAAVANANPDCGFVPSSCNTVPDVIASFTARDTVCVNTPVDITNISLNATSQYWSFCAADANKIPTAVNLGNPGGSLSLPVFSDVVNDNGNYHVFVSNNWPGGLVRMDFGNSLLNAPVVVNLGNIGGVIPNTIEGIQVVKNEGRWYAIMVGGDFATGGIPSRIIKIDIGVNITNPVPVGTNWGNIGNLAYPVDLNLFQENGNWYGFTVNAQNNTITRFNFSNSFTNVPTGVNLGNLGGLNYPTGINAVKDNGNWYVFITNDVVNSFLVRLNFGNSLLNVPTAVNLGNPGNVLHKTRDIYIMKACDKITGLAVNGDGYNDLVKLDFNNNITATPTGISLGNTGNMNFPHSISRLFRAGNDLYSFVTNVTNNTLTRIRFEGCTNSSIPNSALQAPPPITYSTPGVYNINLTVDEGLPTQTSFCKQVVVKDCTVPIIPDFDIPDTVCVNTPVTITNNTIGATSHYWNFCSGDINKTPEGTNLGNIGGLLQMPVFMDYTFYNGNYYGFLINFNPGRLIRLNFGNSLLNTPTATNLGNLGGLIPFLSEGIQIVHNEGRWYAIVVAGYTAQGLTPRILKVDFGPDLTNVAPAITNWGNLGNMQQPIDLHLFQENGNWYGLTVNAENNTITRFNFTNSFNNTPTAVNLGNIGGLAYPDGIYAINDNNSWKVFITNGGDNTRTGGVWSLTRLDFGSSLLNTPTGVNLGNPGGMLKHPSDLTILKSCGEIIGFAVNGAIGSNDVIKLDFNNDLNSVPTMTSLGNTGNLNFPVGITKIFRQGPDLFSFVLNAANNTLTRLRFAGCTNSSIPNSASPNPPPVTYNTPGIYNINLTIDDGLPTQSSICKQVVVKDCTVPIIPDFDIPDTVCVNTPVTIGNNTVGATSHYWNFCSGDIDKTPEGTNLGNIGGLLQMPVFMDYTLYNGNYYGFLINFNPGRLIRLNFGNSLLNTPTSTDLGNLGGLIPFLSEGIQVVHNEGRWYAIVVAGYTAQGLTPRILKVDFGPDLTNITPAITNWGNLGNMQQPIDLHLFQENGSWYGLTVNAENNTITRFNFTSSFNNTPTAVNLGNIGGLAYPDGIFAINDNNSWKVFITNGGDNTRTGGVWSLSRLDFGSSLLNTPTGVNLGNPGGLLKHPSDLTILKSCGEIIGFAVNGAIGSNDVIKLNFNNDLNSVPAMTSLGNIGNLNFPVGITRIFRQGPDLFSFVLNASNNTITRLRFEGCANSSIPNSAEQNPPVITYNIPGTYSINLTIDDGLPTQSSVCKQVVVENCADSIIINEYTPILSFDPCKNALIVENASKFNIGDTVLMIQMKGAVIDSTNTAAFGNITNYRNAGNYEFNYIKAKNGNLVELLNRVERQYDIPLGKVQLVRVPYFLNYNATSTLTCLPWDGNKGGVLVFNVLNTLQLNENIDVSGRGFRGGLPVQNANYVCNVTDFLVSSNDGSRSAAKGEGIVETSTLLYGRGKISNGGGGGNSTNSGGAGGANGGNGGAGGKQYVGSLCNTNFVNGGVGGQRLDYSNANNKIFLGGGGGAGHENENLTTPGGNGGGIVIIGATTIQPNAFKIVSNGITPANVSGLNEDGRSGGGAGGSVLLKYTTLTGIANVEVAGGNGDFSSATRPAVDLHGPGGGGGGGIVWVNKPVYEPSLLTSIAGGQNGTNININSDAWGATPGENGRLLNSLVLPVADVLFKKNIDSVRISKTTVSCSSFDFNGFGYTNTNPVVTWQWSFGDGEVASTQNTSHTYSSTGNYIVKLVVTDINGCKDSITTDVTATALNFDFSYKQNICNLLEVQFNGVGNSLVNSFWDFGDGATITANNNPLHTYTATGDYLVKFSIGNGLCTDTIRKTISINVLWDDLVLTPDTTICYGAVKQLRTVPSLSFCWTPVTYLDNPNSPNPTTSATQDITYYFTAEVTGANIITNGNFSAGNSGFTSQYNFANPNATEGQYFVGANPAAWNNSLSTCTDHTSGNGNMLLVNGSPAPDVHVWRQTVTVTPNTNYAFSTWIQALFTPNPAQLQFSINGKDIGPLITASLPTCTWTQFYTTWNSGDSTTAVISIVNKNTQVQGNDFALDDISFAPVFIKRDSVKIRVERPVVLTNADTTICIGRPVQLNATGAQSYVWTPATGLSSTGTANPVASPVLTTQYIVTGTTIDGCSAKDTVNINIFTKPAIVLSNDTTICKNAQAQLSATGGASYSWSPAATLSNAIVANPIATPLVNTIYHVIIMDVNTCEYLDSVEVSIRPDAVFSINNVQQICRLDSAQLSATGGDIYTWQPAQSLSNSGISNPMASPQATTDYTVTILETTCNQSTTLTTRLTIIPQPTVSATRSNDIDCSNDRSQLIATGADQYIWTPATTLNNAAISNPVATPTTTTEYIVTGANMAGCKGYDTVTVKVDNVNRSGYLMPNAFTPNNDGLNDCYGIKYWGVIEELEFSIYNRWGERIFYTRNVGQCWDGTYKGTKQDGGAYVYMIRAKTTCQSEVFRKGTVVLVR